MALESMHLAIAEHAQQQLAAATAMEGYLGYGDYEPEEDYGYHPEEYYAYGGGVPEDMMTEGTSDTYTDEEEMEYQVRVSGGE
jgi:hypothetical protein